LQELETVPKTDTMTMPHNGIKTMKTNKN